MVPSERSIGPRRSASDWPQRASDFVVPSAGRVWPCFQSARNVRPAVPRSRADFRRRLNSSTQCRCLITRRRMMGLRTRRPRPMELKRRYRHLLQVRPALLLILGRNKRRISLQKFQRLCLRKRAKSRQRHRLRPKAWPHLALIMQLPMKPRGIK